MVSRPGVPVTGSTVAEGTSVRREVMGEQRPEGGAGPRSLNRRSGFLDAGRSLLCRCAGALGVVGGERRRVAFSASEEPGAGRDPGDWSVRGCFHLVP